MYEPDIPNRTRTLALLVGALGCVAVVALASGLAIPTGFTADSHNGSVSEEEYVQPAPEEGDEHYEISSEDYYSDEEQDKYDPWISYDNPRDEYRHPDAGDGSGKICVTLLNERGDVVAGESVPDTRVNIETGDELQWHSQADPFTVRFPITEHYDEMPYDGDQFGTSDDYLQGDGYMDAHCLEFHRLADDETVEYGPAQVAGEYADGVEVVGYIQKEQATWNTDVDPVEDAEPYESVGGSWTMEEDSSHGQVLVVLQLVPEHVHEDYRSGTSTETRTETPTETRTETPTETRTEKPTETRTESTSEESQSEASTETEAESTSEESQSEASTETEADSSTEDTRTETNTGDAQSETTTGGDGTKTTTGDTDDDPAETPTEGDGSNGAVSWLLAVAAIVGSAYGIVARRGTTGETGATNDRRP